MINTFLECMLYYSGYIDRIGEVHDGDTVMDYLDQVDIISSPLFLALVDYISFLLLVVG